MKGDTDNVKQIQVVAARFKVDSDETSTLRHFKMLNVLNEQRHTHAHTTPSDINGL